MVYPILLYDNPALRTASHPIDIKTAAPDEIREMADGMFETMHKAGGIGLSAIQIGVPVRAFVIEAHLHEGLEEDFDVRETFINPVITEKSEKTIYLTEGCLSLPQIAALVERPETVTVEYYNYDLKKVTKEYTGFAARIIQHEMDHLDGVLFTDKLETMWKAMIEPQMTEIAEGRVKPNYLFTK